MTGLIITKTDGVPGEAASVLLQSCKLELAGQLELTLKPELNSFGCTAIEELFGFNSVETYVAALLANHCCDHFLSTDANGRPMVLVSGNVDEDGTFEVLFSMHNKDSEGSTEYMCDPDFFSEDLTEQYIALGCQRWLTRADQATEVPQYMLEQGFVDVTTDETEPRTLQGPFGW